jgi:hypothetical protein
MSASKDPLTLRANILAWHLTLVVYARPRLGTDNRYKSWLCHTCSATAALTPAIFCENILRAIGRLLNVTRNLLCCDEGLGLDDCENLQD